MSTNKIIQALGSAAGSAGGAALNVEEVFSTYLYEGVQLDNTDIVNGIDLSGEGGMVWIKDRSTTYGAYLFDTERGVTKQIGSAINNAEATDVDTVTSFNANGFTIGDDIELNTSGNDYVSWTFRKAPKFFDVVTYTGNSTAGRTISHNLGCAVGSVWVKKLNAIGNWSCWHRSIANTQFLTLNSTNGATNDGGALWNSTSPTSTTVTLGSDGGVNGTGSTYVMYVFAHNNGDGGFGPTGDQDIIKCGSYTGTGSSGNFIDLGFEPQFMLIKNTSSSSNWIIHDNMRGMIESTGNVLFPNLTAAENTTAFRQARPNATGITFFDGNSETNGSGANYIYIAIRRGPMGIPESATDVFAIDTSVNASFPRFTSNFPVDFAISTTTNAGDPRAASSRLTSGKWMRTNDTNAESTNSAYVFDSNDGYFDSTLTNGLAWMWKRAPGYFDVVCYTGTGNNSTRMVDHNLTVKPEMVWIKRRDDLASWFVTTESLGVNNYLNLESNGTGSTYTNIGAHTATQFSARGLDATNGKFVAYLFATAPGVSKVGSYTGNGSSQTIDCGFSSGARFVLIKQTDTSGTNWFVFDSERGIVSGNDSALRLNTTDAAVTNEDAIDPVSSGFSVTNSNGFIDTNNSGGTYIFYAIA